MNQNFGQLGKQTVNSSSLPFGPSLRRIARNWSDPILRVSRNCRELLRASHPKIGLIPRSSDLFRAKPRFPSPGRGQLGKQTVNFLSPHTRYRLMAETFVANFAGHLVRVESHLGVTAWIFFGTWILRLGFSTLALSAPVQFDLLPVAPVSSTRPVRLPPVSSSFQSNQSGANSTKPELSGANWTKTAFWLAAARSSRSTNGKARTTSENCRMKRRATSDSLGAQLGGPRLSEVVRGLPSVSEPQKEFSPQTEVKSVNKRSNSAVNCSRGNIVGEPVQGSICCYSSTPLLATNSSELVRSHLERNSELLRIAPCISHKNRTYSAHFRPIPCKTPFSLPNDEVNSVNKRSTALSQVLPSCHLAICKFVDL
jgi:hypothetical protein